jgi:hypothetical protein
MLRIFQKPKKIQRFRPGLNPRTRVPEASMLTTRPPKRLGATVTAEHYCGTPRGYCTPFVAEGLRHGDVISNDNTEAAFDNRSCDCLRICGWEIMEPSFLRSRSRAQWFPSLCTPQEAPAWQTICSRFRCEASFHLKATNTWYPFLRRPDSRLGDMGGKRFMHQWWQRGGYPCNVCVEVKKNR